MEREVIDGAEARRQEIKAMFESHSTWQWAVKSVRNYKMEHLLFHLYLLIAKMLFSLLNLFWVLVSLMLKSYL